MTEAGGIQSYLNLETLMIIGVSLRVSLVATTLASLCSIPLGFAIAIHNFKGKQIVVTIMNTLLALPTVVVGLFVYSLLSRSGPLGFTRLLYTPTAMVIGQFILATPIITALTYSAAQGVDKRVRPTALTLGANSVQTALMVVKEAKYGIIAAVAAGFGRVIAEVGSAIMVGGNIKGYTRTITTAIALETSKGEFATGMLLGVVLLVLALGLNLVVNVFLRGEQG